MLEGTFNQGENNQPALMQTALFLFYIAGAKSPDVYKPSLRSF